MSEKKFGKDLIENNLQRNYWEKYFDKKALNSEFKESFDVNGFIDRKLVFLLRKILRNILINYNFKHVYDCGCGDGSVTSPLINKGIKIYGIDISKEMCKIAGEKGLKTFQFDMDKLTKYSFEELNICENNGTTNDACILFCESLTCTQNPARILKGVCKKNKNFKNILLSFPNEKSLIRKFVNLITENNLTYFGIKTIEKYLKSYNFQKIELVYIIGVPFIFYFELRVNKKSLLINFYEKFLSLIAINNIILYKKF